MKKEISNSEVIHIFKKLIDFLKKNSHIHSMIIQSKQPITFLTYNNEIQYSNDIIFNPEQVGDIARNYIHNDYTKEQMIKKNTTTEIYDDGTDKSLYLTIFRTESIFSLVVTIRRSLSEIENINQKVDFNHIMPKLNEQSMKILEQETIKNVPIEEIIPTILKEKGTTVITGNNIYKNNFIGAKILDAANVDIKTINKSNNKQGLIIATIESPMYFEMQRKYSILYRYHYGKDLYDIMDLFNNHTIMNQIELLYINCPNILKDAKIFPIFKRVAESKICIIIEEDKTIKSLSKEYSSSNGLKIIKCL